jgi:hypothetical protein
LEKPAQSELSKVTAENEALGSSEQVVLEWSGRASVRAIDRLDCGKAVKEKTIPVFIKTSV